MSPITPAFSEAGNQRNPSDAPTPNSQPFSGDSDRDEFEAWKRERDAKREAAERDTAKSTSVRQGNTGKIERQDEEVYKRQEEDDSEPEWYVHLANGEVIRVAESDLPTSAGTNASNGHWQKDGKIHLVTGVYPVETEINK